jgi:DNA-binding transcriptional LysR family regulator
MPPGPSVEDLRLVVAVADTGSIGQAAALLRIAQPSASQRLALLERRLGVSLFERGPTGARPSASGAALTEHARRILDLVEHAVAQARSAEAGADLAAGTFASLAPAIFTALDSFLRPDITVHQRTDHAPRLLEAMADGVMDLAVVALASGTAMPPGLVRVPLGSDRLVLLLPDTVPAPEPGRHGLADRTITLATYSGEQQRIGDRLAARGARVVYVASASVALAIARRRGVPAAVPRSAVQGDVRPGERIVSPGITLRVPLSMIVPKRPDPRLDGVADAFRREMGLGGII